MVQRLIVDVEKCTECRACELKCSFVHFGVFNTRKSGVRIVSDWPELARARVCIQCEEPECLSVCPTEALVYTESGAITVLQDTCNGCESCVEACPYFLNPSRLARLGKARLYEEMKNQYNVMDCVECGSCTFACPSGIPIVQHIRTAKDHLRNVKRKEEPWDLTKQ